MEQGCKRERKENKVRKEVVMKIAFDIQPLLHSAKSGVGFHEEGLIRTMIWQFPKHQYYLELFTKKDRKRKLKIAKKYQAGKKYVKIQECRWFSGTLYRFLFSFFTIPYRFFFREKAEITHFFNFCIPPGVYGKKVVTIHDMAFRRYPETVRFRTKKMLQFYLKKSIKRADAIVTVSKFTKQELLYFYKVPKEKVFVVSNGVNRAVFRPDYSNEKVEQVKASYGIFGDYFLYLGTLEPRKNLLRLVMAYQNLQQERKEMLPKLVLAGGTGWMCSELFQTVEQSEQKEQILFTGYIKDRDVPLLMKGASVFCFPSLYEGFGMPVLEAMACGTPVLTSNRTALAEIAGEAAVKVNPESIGELKEGLKRLYQDRELAEKCREKGLERAEYYTWKAAAKRLEAVYQSLEKKDKNGICS